MAEVLSSGRWFGSELARRSPALGVRSTGGDLQSAYLLVRGASPVQTAYFLDGLPLLSGFGGLLDAAGLPAAGLDAVELFRGAVPAEFGPDAAGGALNLVPALRVSGGVFRMYDTRGSFGTWKTSWFGAHARGRWMASGAFSYATTLGNYPYFYDGGTIYTTADDGVRLRENNHVEQVQAMGTAARTFAWGRLRAVWLAAHRRAGVPGPHSIVTRFTRHERARLRAQLTAETPAGRSDAYAENVRERYRDPFGELGVGAADDLHGFFLAGLRHRLLHDSGRHEASLIAHVFAERWVPVRLTFGDTTPRTRLTAWISGRLRFRFSRWNLSAVVHGAAVRPDGHAVAAAPVGDPLPAVAPHAHAGGFLGISFRAADGLHLKANLSRAFREPAFSELYGDFGVVKGNAALRPEQSWNADAGARWDGRFGSSRLVMETAVFGRRVEDLIQYIPNSQFVSLPMNVGSARFAGVEAGLGGTLGNWNLRAQGTFLHTRNDSGLTESDGNPLPGRPQWMFSASAGYDADLPRGHRAGFEIAWTHQRGGYFDLAARRPMPERHDAGIRLYWKLPGERVTLSLDLRNLTNDLWTRVQRLPAPPTGEVYHPQAVCDQLGYPIPGRSIFFTVAISPL